ncbi:MAG: alpha-mannosidase, partial [Spirulinaceae cyanobacterium]
MNQFSQDIAATITKLTQQTEIDVQSEWYYSSEQLNVNSNSFPLTILKQGQKVELNEKGYIVFGAGSQVIWLAQKITIPHRLDIYPLAGLSLRLALTWWAAEAQIFVDGKLLQEGDLFDSSARVLLRESVTPQEELVIAIRLVSPGHDIGALMASKCIYEAPLDPGFVAQEMLVLQKYLAKFEPEKLGALATELDKLNWQVATNQAEFNQALLKLRQNLLSLAINLKQRCIQMLTHAHLDLAWLWEVEETWEVAQRTFASVLKLKLDFPELTFCHTSPVLYQWLEKNRPQLFKEIQEAVKAGWWEVLGGMWVEPDVNLPSGESLVRQLLYGQKYTKEKFGQITKIAWLTDSFGFSWQLPQIFKQCGIEYFVTQKLHWNDSTKFPYSLFYWQGLDGTQLPTLMSPPNVTGVMDTNPLTQINYAVEWEQQTEIQDIFWLPGVGDHGGGPSRDMLEVQRCWQKSPFFPQLKFTTAENYLNQVSKKDSLPIWQSELYLELHRGCYTTHGEQKRYNRRCEDLLYEAELWSSLATIITKSTYPQQELEKAWKKVLFNQFHDILPGTSITPVFTEANQNWQKVMETGAEIKEKALQKIAAQISLPTPPKP